MKDTVAPALTQWGTPVQWWDVSHYPKLTTSLTLWAWEFVRRSPGYRKFWREKALPYYDAGAADKVDEEAYWAEQERLLQLWPLCFEAVSLQEQAERRFGVFGDPCRGDRHRGFKNFGAKHRRPMSEKIIAALNKGKKRWDGHHLNLKGNEVNIDFNADWPIEPQLARARMILEMYQPADAKGPRPRGELFAPYLQVLDATDSKVSAAGIAKALFPRMDDTQPDYLASHRVRGMLTAARKMRDSGYRYLAASKIP